MTFLGADSMNPIALQIGTLIGLFIKEKDGYLFNNAWFNNPWDHISAIPSNPQMLELLTTLMTSAEANAVGVSRTMLNRTWYPILNPLTGEGENDKPTGIYIVATKPVEGVPTELGIGSLYEWKYDSFSILPYAYFPVIKLPANKSDNFNFILGADGHPVETGINITGSNGVFNTGNGIASLSFDGFQAASEIYFKQGKYPSLNLTFLNLKLPGEKQGSNRSLFDLIYNASVQQSITVALSVLGSQLSQFEGAAATAGKMINSILELLGLLGPVPGIDWEALVKDPSAAARVFTLWLQNIGNDNTILKTWLNDWYCLFNGLDAGEKMYVTGEGTRAKPFDVTLLSAKFTDTMSVNFAFTFAALKTPAGILQLFPGFNISTSPILPIQSMPEFGITVSAEVEVLRYDINTKNGGAASITLFPGYSIMATAANTVPDKPLFAVADLVRTGGVVDNANPPGLSIGSMNIGFVYDKETAASSVPSPNFRLYEVQTAIGAWPLIDLSNFNVQTLEQAIGPAVSQAIKSFFGEDNKYARAFTAVFGIDPPSIYEGEWPLKNKMLLSPEELPLLIKNPFAAIGAYYSRCLTTKDSNDKTLFEFLVPDFSTLLGSESSTVIGHGTEKEPWEIQLLKVGTADIRLAMWNPGTDLLAMAFDFSVPLPFSVVTAVFGLRAAIMVMQLPGNEGKGTWNAAWMQAVTGKLAIKDSKNEKLQTPSLAGVSIAAADVYVQGGWKNAGSFFVVAGIDKLQLNSSAGVVELGNIEFSTVGWGVDQLKQFAPAIVNGLGLLMLENGGTIGVLVTTTLGMLPNLNKIFDGQEHPEYKFPIPEYFILPANWPVLSVTDFANPWNNVRKQLSALFSNGDFMNPLMQLVGWGITGVLPGAPDIVPVGTLADPWSVTIPQVWNIELLTWVQSGQAGVGVQKQLSVSASKNVQLASVIRLDVPAFMLVGQSGPTNNYPGLSFVNLLQNPNIPLPLVDLGGLIIDKVQFGVFVQLVDGELQLIPIFRFLHSRLKSTEVFRDIELIPVPGKPQFTSNDAIDAFNSLVNAMMEKLSDTIQKEGFTQLQAFLDILQLYGMLDVMIDEDTKAKTYSFNPGGWASLLSNPGGYLFQRSKEILVTGQLCADLMKAVAQLLGYQNFQLPAVWQGVQYLLQSLELMKEYSGYFVPQFNAWLAFFNNPIDYLRVTVSKLFNSPEMIRQLVTNVSKLAMMSKNENDLRKFFSVDSSGYIITISIPTDKIISIGDDLQLFFDMVIDVNALTITNSLALGTNTLDSAIAFQWIPGFKDGYLTNDFGFYLTTIPGAPQAFPPLQLWPFPADKQKYIQQIGFQVPMTLLSSFTVKYLNDFVVPQNPAVNNIFKVLGLTSNVEGKELIRPLTGIFMNPVGWLLSPEVLGNGLGSVDLTKLGHLLYAIAGAAVIKNGNIELKSYEHDGKKDGVQLTGLPWGVSFFVFANTEDGANLGGAFSPSLPSPAPQIKLTGGVGFGTPNGVAVSGSIDMSYNLGKSSSGPSDNTLGIKAAYAKRAFTLTAYANTNEYALLPFGGLNQFLNEGTVGVLLNVIGDKLFAAYHDYVAKNPATALKPFVDSIELLSGIKDGTTLFNFFDAIYKDPLGQFTEANIVKTLPNINKFVTDILTLKGFSVSADNKLLIYEHTFQSVPGAKVAIRIGLDTIGQNNVFGIWLEPVAKFSWIWFGLNKTGVGVVMPVNYSSPQIQYEVNIGVGANFTTFGIPNSPEPVLTFGLNGSLNTLNGPNLKFYPVKVSGDPGTLLIELLPNPQLQIVGSQNVTTEQWMINFGVDFLVPFAANMALGVAAVKNWLNTAKIGNVTGIPGKVLVDWGLLVKKDDSYYLANLKTAFNLNDPVGIVTKLIFSALNLLDGQRVVAIKDHGIYVQSEKTGDVTRYGLRIQITDIAVTSPDKDGTKLLFQLGKYYGDQNKDNNWTGLKSEPGFVVYFINRNSVSNTMSFMPKFELISIGLDFTGANAQSPLINTKGVTIQAVEPRVYVSLDFDGTIKKDFGAGIMLYSIGVPLGPGFNNQGSSSNPVAQNLLSSGGDKGKTDAINPSFSVSASYVYNAQAFNLQLYDANGLPTNKVWISIMRAFGPLQCRKVGIGWKSSDQEKRLDFLFDGQVSLAGLMANLVELDIGIPISDPTNFGKYSLDLAGLDVSYNAGAVTIGGGFLKDDSAGYVQYTGQALIQTSGFGIGAFGSYALIDKHPSLFIFAYLNAPLGGPPFFFVNGLSGGFGYNRTINIPPAAQIENFPFVAGVEDPAALGGKDGQAPTAEEALKALGTKIVPPQLGSYWIAAGVMFSSFQIIDSKAVLMVIFGNDFEIALVGLSGMKLPKKGKTYVGAQIAFRVTYKVSTGLLAMEAVLTSNSYVIDPNCRLTGGLAFYVWFKDQLDTGAKAGEFVFTLGGYNPAFKKPTYFPDEPRLGFSWSLGDVTIKGGAYFALTPSAVMAGGSLEAVYKSGNLKAWFTAYADFLIMWNPFYYDIRVGVSVGASYTVKFIWTTTFKVELGADVHIWGPAMAGSATVHWWVISFTVHFGATSSGPNDSRIIDWKEFNPYFLPQDQKPAAPPQQQPESTLLRRSNAGVRAIAQETVPVQQVSHIKQTAGLIKELPNTDADVSKTSPALWQITADGFAFIVTTVVPLNSITVNGLAQPITSNVEFGIRPMGSVVFGKPGQMSTLDFKLYYNTDEYKDLRNWAFAAELNGVPESLWGTVNNGKTAIDSKIIPGALVGLSARVVSAEDNLPKGGPPMFPLSNLGYAAWAWRKLTLADNPQLHPTSPAVQTTTSLRVIEDSIMIDAVVKVRTAILNAVVSAGINVLTDGRLDQMAAYATDTFQSFPMLGELGSLGYQKTLTTDASRTFNRSVKPAQLKDEPAPAMPVHTKAVIIQYARPELSTPVFMAASLTDIKLVRPVKGTMYNTEISHETVFNAIKQGRRLQASTDENKQEYDLYPGVSVMIDVDPNGSAPMLEFNGELPLFASWYDVHNQLVGSELLRAGIQLPQGVCTIIVAGVNTELLQLPYAYGWHTTSQLTLVNPNALTGIGAIVIPDGPIRVMNNGTSNGYGLITGQKMAESNRIVSGETTMQAGFKTIMPAELRTIAVLSDKKKDMDFDPNSIEVVIKIDTAGVPEYRKLQGAAVINGLLEAAVLFEVPADTGYTYNLVYAKSLGNAFITGVLGLQENVAEVQQQWEQVVLQPAIPYPYVMPQKHTLITISQA